MLTYLFILLIASLVAGRIAYLVTQDDIARPLRSAVSKTEFLADLFSCPYCMSLWTALIGWLTFRLTGGDIPMGVLAIYPHELAVDFVTVVAIWAGANSYAVKAI